MWGLVTTGLELKVELGNGASRFGFRRIASDGEPDRDDGLNGKFATHGDTPPSVGAGNDLRVTRSRDSRVRLGPRVAKRRDGVSYELMAGPSGCVMATTRGEAGRG